MPSTARVNIAGTGTTSHVETEVDDVISTSYGRQRTIDAAVNVVQGVVWPITGETLVYLRFQKGVASYNVTVAATSAEPGWNFTVPIGTGPFPIILGKPSTGEFFLTPTAAITVQAYFM